MLDWRSHLADTARLEPGDPALIALCHAWLEPTTETLQEDPALVRFNLERVRHHLATVTRLVGRVLDDQGDRGRQIALLWFTEQILRTVG